MNGCHNRAPLRDTAIVQSGWRDGYNGSRMPMMIEIPDNLSKNCMYQRNKKNDPKCAGCIWKDVQPSDTLNAGSFEGKIMDAAIEQEIQEKGLTAPRITPADIEANITDTDIVKHVSKSGQILRWAVLTTANGFAVVGKPSCAVSSENDNAEIGEKIAIANSKEELWPLMGYELRSRLNA